MYSEIVDTAMSRSGRPDRQADIEAFLNQTIRDLQAPHYFAKNLVEDTITVSGGDDPFIWQRPDRLQRVRTCRYPDGTFPDMLLPGRAQKDEIQFYYAASTYYAFKGLTQGEEFNIAYYQFRKRLRYFASGARPAVYNFSTETWTYFDLTAPPPPYNLNYDLDDTNRAIARELVSHWLLQDWYDLCQEGTLAKLFKVINDEKRAATHFSFFERSRADTFMKTEAYEAVPA